MSNRPSVDSIVHFMMKLYYAQAKFGANLKYRIERSAYEVVVNYTNLCSNLVLQFTLTSV